MIRYVKSNAFPITICRSIAKTQKWHQSIARSYLWVRSICFGVWESEDEKVCVANKWTFIQFLWCCVKKSCFVRRFMDMAICFSCKHMFSFLFFPFFISLFSCFVGNLSTFYSIFSLSSLHILFIFIAKHSVTVWNFLVQSRSIVVCLCPISMFVSTKYFWWLCVSVDLHFLECYTFFLCSVHPMFVFPYMASDSSRGGHTKMCVVYTLLVVIRWIVQRWEIQSPTAMQKVVVTMYMLNNFIGIIVLRTS